MFVKMQYNMIYEIRVNLFVEVIVAASQLSRCETESSFIWSHALVFGEAT